MFEKHTDFLSIEEESKDKISSEEQEKLREEIKEEISKKKDGTKIDVDLLNDDDLNMYKKYFDGELNYFNFKDYSDELLKDYYLHYKSDDKKKRNRVESRFNFKAFLANRLTSTILDEARNRKREKGKFFKRVSSREKTDK